MRIVSSFTEKEARVDIVSRSVGPLYFATIDIEGMCNGESGSSVTIISYDRFKEIGRKAGLSVEALKCPDVMLRDYNQPCIPIGAKVELTVK